MDTRILKQFLNASLKPLRRQREVTLLGTPAKRVTGFIHSSVMYESTSGVPQDGIISPTIANMVLHGLENTLKVNRKY